MSNGLILITAGTANDLFLTGNPQITHFKILYKRHTRFAIEPKNIEFNGTVNWGQTVSCTIPKNGDLLYKTYVRINLPEVTPSSGKNFRWLNWLGHVLIKSVKLEIGSQEIVKHYGEWFHILNEMNQKPGQQSNYARLVGNVPKLVQPSTSTKPATELLIPLQFFFCQHPGSALPLVALSNHDVRLQIEFNTKENCYWSENVTESAVGDITGDLLMNFIHLDSDERKKIAAASHEYLIEQLQYSGDEAITTNNLQVEIPFHHPVHSLYWVIQKDDHINRTEMQDLGGPQWFNFTDRVDTTSLTGTPNFNLGAGLGGASFINQNLLAQMSMGGETSTLSSSAFNGLSTSNAFVSSSTNNIDLDTLTFQNLFGNGNTSNAVAYNAPLAVFDNGDNPVSEAKIVLNNRDVITYMSGIYFNHIVPYETYANGPAPGINMFSFNLDPANKEQPKGSVNFTFFDSRKLDLRLTNNTVLNESSTATSAKCRVYALNYNILRIMGGMGAIAYNS